MEPCGKIVNHFDLLATHLHHEETYVSSSFVILFELIDLKTEFFS